MHLQKTLEGLQTNGIRTGEENDMISYLTKNIINIINVRILTIGFETPCAPLLYYLLCSSCVCQVSMGKCVSISIDKDVNIQTYSHIPTARRSSLVEAVLFKYLTTCVTIPNTYLYKKRKYTNVHINT